MRNIGKSHHLDGAFGVFDVDAETTPETRIFFTGARKVSVSRQRQHHFSRGNSLFREAGA